MHHGRQDDFCGCGIHGYEQGYRRRFLTKAEKTEKLKNYAEELKKELRAVEEKIKEMQS
jgi:hypothetical protein